MSRYIVYEGRFAREFIEVSEKDLPYLYEKRSEIDKLEFFFSKDRTTCFLTGYKHGRKVYEEIANVLQEN